MNICLILFFFLNYKFFKFDIYRLVDNIYFKPSKETFYGKIGIRILKIISFLLDFEFFHFDGLILLDGLFGKFGVLLLINHSVLFLFQYPLLYSSIFRRTVCRPGL